jgi:hypothetical protein
MQIQQAPYYLYDTISFLQFDPYSSQCSILDSPEFVNAQHLDVDADIGTIAKDIYNGIAKVTVSIVLFIVQAIVSVYEVFVEIVDAIGIALLYIWDLFVLLLLAFYDFYIEVKNNRAVKFVV